MCKRLVCLVLTMAFCVSPMARAANIIWVCESIDITGDGTPDDAAWIPWVESLGHTVAVQRGNWTTLDAAKIATLNAADLIIISRCTSSGNYNNDATEIGQWSGITAPILCLAAHFVRNNRWYWFNTATLDPIVGPMMEVVMPGHPIFTGIKLNANGQVAAVDGTTGSGQTSFIGTTDPGNGTLLAKTGTHAWVVEWQPGKPFYASSPQTPAGKRMLFSAGTQEVSPTPIGAFNLTEDGKKMLSNAILYMMGRPVVAGMATDPIPPKGQTDVPRDVTLGWKAGEFAQTHDVYVGLSFPDVNNASRTTPLGVLAGQGRGDSNFAPALQFGQTYYWRVDEVNAPPSTNIVKGEIWSFTVEPFGYPITPVKATASSAQPGMGPEKTIDGSGLDKSGLHGTEPTTMWTSAGGQPNWIQYEFDKVYKLHQLVVWNSNQLIEGFVGFGAKKVTIETSADGTTWTPVANVPEFSQAPAAPGYAANTTVNLGSVDAKYVKLTINTNWGGLAPQAGLAEVRFSYVPAQARLPQPATAATGVSVETTLDWRPGRAAASHKVFFGTDPEAVTKGTASAKTLTTHGFTPDSLNFGTKYYWKVDEVNAVTYPGEVWNFTTQEYQVVDDFESYTDKQGEEVFTFWVDGMVNNNGSTVGLYPDAIGGTFCETTIIHDGKQSMPFEYNNEKTPYYSEAERAFDKAQDWTGHGADTLVLYVQGRGPDFDLVNAATAPVIDGKVDAVWANVPALPIKTLITGAALTGPADASGQFRVLYDATNLYVLVDVNDDQLRNDSTSAYLDDSVELYLDGDNTKKGPGLTGSARQHTFGWTATDVQGTNMSLTGIQHAQANTPTGWRLEIKLPWQSLLGGPAPVGKLIGLDCFYNDDDDGGDTRESQIAWHSLVANDWQTPASWGTARVAASGAAASTDRFYVVLQDSSNRSATVTYPGPEIMRAGWHEWRIPLSEFSAAGVKLTAVKKVVLGVGDKASPKPGATGKLYIDDIGFGHPASASQANP